MHVALLALMLAVQAPAQNPVVVPFELLASKHVALSIRVDGHGPYRVLLDTGSPVNVLSTRLGRDAGLLPPGAKPAAGLLASGTPVTVRSLSLGAVEAADMPALVMDHPTVQQAARMLGPLDGILGLPFFGRYRLTLDYRAATVTLVPNGRQPPDALAAMSGALRALARGEAAAPVVARAALWGLQVGRAERDDRPGVIVRKVAPGGPADRAGLRAGDRLLTVDGRWTDSAADVYQAASVIPPGTVVSVRVRRGEQELALTVTPVRGL